MSTAFGAYFTSFLAPAFQIGKEGEREIFYGFQAFYVSLVIGDLDPTKIALVVWFANPAWWVGVFFYFKKCPTLTIFAGLVGFSLASLMYGRLDLLFGYYLWTSSMFFLVLAGLFAGMACGQKSQPSTKQHAGRA